MTYEERVRQRAYEIGRIMFPHVVRVIIGDMLLYVARLSVQREAEAFDIGYKTANEEPIFGPSTAESTKQSLGLVPPKKKQ